MKITFNIIDFDSRFKLFKESMTESGFLLSDELYMNSVCIFLGYEEKTDLQNKINYVKSHSKLDLFLHKIKNTFTTSLISHSEEKDPVLQKTKDQTIILEEEALKKYTYQQFKKGISQVSSYLKKKNVNISQSSLLKAFSIFLGYKNWNTLSSVIKQNKEKVYNILAYDYNTIIESAFLVLDEGVDTIYFVDLDAANLIQKYLKNVNTLKHKYKVPFKEILKVKRISKNEINETLFNGNSVCFISDEEETSLYIFNNFIKNNKKYQLK